MWESRSGRPKRLCASFHPHRTSSPTLVNTDISCLEILNTARCIDMARPHPTHFPPSQQPLHRRLHRCYTRKSPRGEDRERVMLVVELGLSLQKGAPPICLGSASWEEVKEQLMFLLSSTTSMQTDRDRVPGRSLEFSLPMQSAQDEKRLLLGRISANNAKALSSAMLTEV